jgi:hypothetical protein
VRATKPTTCRLRRSPAVELWRKREPRGPDDAGVDDEEPKEACSGTQLGRRTGSLRWLTRGARRSRRRARASGSTTRSGRSRAERAPRSGTRGLPRRPERHQARGRDEAKDRHPRQPETSATSEIAASLPQSRQAESDHDEQRPAPRELRIGGDEPHPGPSVDPHRTHQGVPRGERAAREAGDWSPGARSRARSWHGMPRRIAVNGQRCLLSTRLGRIPARDRPLPGRVIARPIDHARPGGRTHGATRKLAALARIAIGVLT